MTNEEKVQAFKMRLEGKTFQEIAECFGVTKQNIHQVLNVNIKNGKKKEKIIYPNLADWMYENEICAKKLAKLLNENYSINTSEATMFRKLKGECAIPLATARKIAELANMKIDECFQLKVGSKEKS